MPKFFRMLMNVLLMATQTAIAPLLLVTAQPAAAATLDEQLSSFTEGLIPDFGNIDSAASAMWDRITTRENLTAGTIVLGVAAGAALVYFGGAAAIGGAVLAAGKATVAALMTTEAAAVAAGLYIGGTAIYYDAKDKAAERKAELARMEAVRVQQEEQYKLSQAAIDREKGRKRETERDHALTMNGLIEREYQGLRVDLGNGFATAFSGSNTEGTLNYDGLRSGGRIAGGYSNREEGETYVGVFSGSIQRNGTVSGTYVEGNEVGSFLGQASASLDQVFGGGTSCDSGCD